MQLFPPSITLLCIASLHSFTVKYSFSDGDRTLLRVVPHYDLLATTRQRRPDGKLEIQNNFGLKTVQCV